MNTGIKEIKTAEEMLPCPFCGGEPEIRQTGKNGLTLRCKSCVIGITQKTLRNSLEWLQNKMVEDWNKRFLIQGDESKGEDTEPYFGWCDVEGCSNEGCSGGNCWRETGYWTVCSQHSKLWRAGASQPQMKKTAIDREKSRKPDGILPAVEKLETIEQVPCLKCGKGIREQLKGCNVVDCYRQHLSNNNLLSGDAVEKEQQILTDEVCKKIVDEIQPLPVSMQELSEEEILIIGNLRMAAQVAVNKCRLIFENKSVEKEQSKIEQLISMVDEKLLEVKADMSKGWRGEDLNLLIQRRTDLDFFKKYLSLSNINK